MSVMSMAVGGDPISTHPTQEVNSGRRPPPKRQFIAKRDFSTAPEPR